HGSVLGRRDGHGYILVVCLDGRVLRGNRYALRQVLEAQGDILVEILLACNADFHIDLVALHDGCCPGWRVEIERGLQRRRALTPFALGRSFTPPGSGRLFRRLIAALPRDALLLILGEIHGYAITGVNTHLARSIQWFAVLGPNCTEGVTI